jgi:hypothetical protein
MYTVMYFGLTNAPTYFMDLMNKVFMKYLVKFIILFINDISVYTKDERKYKEHLRMVWHKLRDHRLYAKVSRCKFWVKQVYFLSHVILEEGMSMDSSKIRDMLSWNAPASVSDVHSFLGLVGYYRKFIKGFSKITKPTTELLGMY